MIRIVLADDHTLCRAGLRVVAEEMTDVEVVAEVSDGHEALRAIEELKPDVAVVRVSLPGLDGPELARSVTGHAPQSTRIILLSGGRDLGEIRRALAAGAAGYLPSDADRGELERAVRAVASGKRWLSPEVVRRPDAAGAPEATPEPRETLTPRQREVLQLVAEGLSTKEIARRLDLSTKTVDTHRAELMQRLAIRGVAGLVRYAIREGIIAA